MMTHKIQKERLTREKRSDQALPDLRRNIFWELALACPATFEEPEVFGLMP